MRRLLVIGLSVLFAALLAGCGPQAVYVVNAPTTTTTTIVTVPPTTTTTIALEVGPTVTCPSNYSWNGADCGFLWNGVGTKPPNVPATITCPDGYSLEDTQATGYYQECVLS